MSDWTTDKQKAWEDTWKESHMVEGLAILKERCRVPGAVLITPGLDLKEIASQSYAHAQGQSDVFDKIEQLKPKAVAKPLPSPFQLTPRPSANSDPE